MIIYICILIFMAITGLVGVILCGIALDAIKNGKHSYDFVSKRAKQYRPFANAAEFKPHRDRWVRRISDGLAFRCSSYGGGVLVVYANILPTFSEAFEQFVFDDDSTPFGVEIKD
jgi:hypothetical protein